MNPLEVSALVAGVLLVIGALLKRAVPGESFETRWIPLILVVIGTPLFCALLGTWSVMAACNGLLAAASAIGLHQTAKQTTGLNL